MGLLETIKNILSLNKKNAQIYATTLQKTYGETEPLEIGLYDGKTPIANTTIKITINKVPYNRQTDSNGIAKLNINLGTGSYIATIEFETETYNYVKTTCDVIIKPRQQNTRMEGTDINMTYQDGTKYQCAVYDEQNHRVSGTVNITVNGRTYTRQADDKGLYKLNINLNQGTYPVKAEYLGSELFKPSYVNNTIKVNPKPVEPPKVEPQKSRSEKILDEFEKYFGKCEYIDDALAKIQGNGYAFYFSDGYNMYDTIIRIAKGQGANCYDSAELFYHLMLGMNTKYGRNYEPQYLHVWCPVSNYDHIRLRFKSNGTGWYYRDPASVLSGNDVESNWCGTSNNIMEVNPSFILDG